MDESSGEVRGEPEPVRTPSTFATHVSFSGDGTRMAYTSTVVSFGLPKERGEDRDVDSDSGARFRLAVLEHLVDSAEHLLGQPLQMTRRQVERQKSEERVHGKGSLDTRRNLTNNPLTVPGARAIILL